MASFKFVLRPSSKAGRHVGTLSLRVIQDRKPKTVSLPWRLYSEEWDEAMQVVLFSSSNYSRRDYLSGVQGQITLSREKLNGIILNLEKKGRYTTADVLGAFHRASEEDKLLSYVSTLSRELMANGQYRTANAYGTVCRKVTIFNNGDNILLKNIDNMFVRKFEMYLKENGKRPNTISYYMRNLRAIYNKAVEEKRIVAGGENPFAGVFTGVEETKKRALSADEVNRLRTIDFKKLFQQSHPNTREHFYIQGLFSSWQLFFFCLYAHGMCFVDMAFLKKSHVNNGVIRYYRRKTGKQIEVPVNEEMQLIIDRFAPMMENSEYLFPVVKREGSGGKLVYETAMRTQNRRLKKLAEMTGLSKGVSTHVARHSWATICKNELLPLSVISEGLGHSSEKMTRKYLASFDQSVLGNAGKTVLMAISRTSDFIVDPY